LLLAAPTHAVGQGDPSTHSANSEQVCVNIHRDHASMNRIRLTLNSGRKNNRWGSIPNRTAVPSLVGADGIFFCHRGSRTPIGP
jgi:hypothetical protein